ncbi:MAG: sugar transferase [Bacillota bacterium]
MYKYVKRVADFIFALLALIFSSWIMLLCVLAIKLEESSAPVMYNAPRIGRNGKPFVLYKFRTMRPAFTGKAMEPANLSSVGALLRKFSLDELPQLINVLKGDMSIIGPRPLLLRYYPWYTVEENKRHQVLPGITGYAQVNGRVRVQWPERFMMDVYYVEHLSFRLDIRIVCATIKKVLGRADVLPPESEPTVGLFDEFRRKQIQDGIISSDMLANMAVDSGYSFEMSIEETNHVV